MVGMRADAAPADALIARVLAAPITGATLRQDAAHYAGLSTAEAERVRGHVLAACETRGVPADAVALLGEELRTSMSPVVLAGAARAVRGLAPEVAASPQWRTLLADAAARIADRDVFVRWQAGLVAPGWLRTARGELLATLDGLPPASGADPTSAVGPDIPLDRDLLRAVVVEDQAGERLTLEQLLDGATTTLAFFYTRCMNPQKCSLTITRLAALTAHPQPGTRIVAMSYDPEFDTPARLRRYGAERGFVFGGSARIVRCVEGWQSVRGMLRLQVGYGPTTVNEHARELFRVTADLVAEGLDADVLA